MLAKIFTPDFRLLKLIKMPRRLVVLVLHDENANWLEREHFSLGLLSNAPWQLVFTGEKHFMIRLNGWNVHCLEWEHFSFGHQLLYCLCCWDTNLFFSSIAEIYNFSFSMSKGCPFFCWGQPWPSTIKYNFLLPLGNWNCWLETP